MVKIMLKKTTGNQILDLPDHVKTIRQLKNNIITNDNNYRYDNLKIVLEDNNNIIYLEDDENIFDNDILILSIIPIII